MSVIVDQFRISDDCKRMYINVHVNNAEYFKNVYLDSITIMTAEKVSETNPWEPTEDYIYKTVFKGSGGSTDFSVFDRTFDRTFRFFSPDEKGIKSADLVLDVQDFIRTWETDPKAMRFTRDDMSKTLFFMYIKCKGVPSACTPCTLDEEITIAVTFDANMLHQRAMGFIKGLADTCQIPKDFVDFILLWNTFKSAIETEHWIDGIRLWRQLFNMWVSGGGISKSVRGCGCNKQ